MSDSSLNGKVGKAPTVPEFCKASNQAAGGTSQTPVWKVAEHCPDQTLITNMFGAVSMDQVVDGAVRESEREVATKPFGAPYGTPQGRALGATISDLAVAPKANDVQVGGSHYKLAIQPWDYTVANKLGYLQGNIIKYATRYPDKNGMEDLKKLRHYVDKLIEVCEADGVRNT